MAEMLAASSGWTVSHWFYRVDRARWRDLTSAAREAAVAETRAWLTACQGEAGSQLVSLALIGKADLGLILVHPDLWRHQQLGQELAATGLGAYLTPVYSFLSLSEASEYMSSEADWARTLIEDQNLTAGSSEFAERMESFRKRIGAYAEARLYPHLPDNYPIVCFYPMTKARGEARNWYTLPFGERKTLMLGHGEAGRRYAGRVTQLITTCTGIDDWEWGITLFAGDLKAIRDVVYEMRFDRGSALYGLFGPFYVGIRFVPDRLGSVLKL